MTADLSVATIMQSHCDAPTTFATRDADHFAAGDNADHAHPWESPWIDLGGEG